MTVFVNLSQYYNSLDDTLHFVVPLSSTIKLLSEILPDGIKSKSVAKRRTSLAVDIIEDLCNSRTGVLYIHMWIRGGLVEQLTKSANAFLEVEDYNTFTVLITTILKILSLDDLACSTIHLYCDNVYSMLDNVIEMYKPLNSYTKLLIKFVQKGHINSVC